jgi:hypothetical protein
MLALDPALISVGKLLEPDPVAVAVADHVNDHVNVGTP